jgi:hypothetical protein
MVRPAFRPRIPQRAGRTDPPAQCPVQGVRASRPGGADTDQPQHRACEQPYVEQTCRHVSIRDRDAVFRTLSDPYRWKIDLCRPVTPVRRHADGGSWNHFRQHLDKLRAAPGRGPTNDISPRNTLNNCGNSSVKLSQQVASGDRGHSLCTTHGSGARFGIDTHRANLIHRKPAAMPPDANL